MTIHPIAHVWPSPRYTDDVRPVKLRGLTLASLFTTPSRLPVTRVRSRLPGIPTYVRMNGRCRLGVG